jgi:hypothetical protein
MGRFPESAAIPNYPPAGAGAAPFGKAGPLGAPLVLCDEELPESVALRIAPSLVVQS